MYNDRRYDDEMNVFRKKSTGGDKESLKAEK